MGPYFGCQGSLLGPSFMKSWVPIGSLFLSMEVPISLGNSVVGIKKWSPFFVSASEVPFFWHLETGTFGKSAHFQVPKNGTSDAQI